MKVLDPQHSGKASGSIDGRTFYNYGNINCVRKLGIPAQPNTDRQLEVRSVMTDISRIWSTDLTEGQRVAWNNFAPTFVWTDLWGKEFVLKGIALFQKFNFPLVDSGKTPQITPPPAISPSDIEFDDQSETEFYVTALSAGEIAAQDPFIQLWGVADCFIDATNPPPALSHSFRGEYLPQGVNPVKSDYRVKTYWTDLALQVVNILWKPTIGDTWLLPTRVAWFMRRYNKYGRYSNTKVLSVVVPAG